MLRSARETTVAVPSRTVPRKQPSVAHMCAHRCRSFFRERRRSPPVINRSGARERQFPRPLSPATAVPSHGNGGGGSLSSSLARETSVLFFSRYLILRHSYRLCARAEVCVCSTAAPYGSKSVVNSRFSHFSVGSLIPTPGYDCPRLRSPGPLIVIFRPERVCVVDAHLFYT